MKKILLTAAESSLRSSSYVSPEAKVSEMHSEGGAVHECTGALEATVIRPPRVEYR